MRPFVRNSLASILFAALFVVCAPKALAQTAAKSPEASAILTMLNRQADDQQGGEQDAGK